MKSTLGTLCQIFPGAAFRARLPERAGGRGVPVVQAKDIVLDGTIDKSRVVYVDAADIPGNAEPLRPGDVLVQPRGRTYKAGVVGEDLNGAVPAAPVYTLRPQSPRLDPAWLALVINAPATQAILAASARGTFIPLVPREAVRELQIDIPDIERQRSLVMLAALAAREHDIAQLVFDARMKLIAALGSDGKHHAQR